MHFSSKQLLCISRKEGETESKIQNSIPENVIGVGEGAGVGEGEIPVSIAEGRPGTTVAKDAKT